MLYKSLLEASHEQRDSASLAALVLKYTSLLFACTRIHVSGVVTCLLRAGGAGKGVGMED